MMIEDQKVGCLKLKKKNTQVMMNNTKKQYKEIR